MQESLGWNHPATGAEWAMCLGPCKTLGTANARNLFFTNIAHINIRPPACAGLFSCSTHRVDAVKGRKLLTICRVDGLVGVKELVGA